MLLLTFALLLAASVQAQLPITSPKAAEFDPARLEVMHATVEQFVDEGERAGIITLVARNVKTVDLQAYGYLDLEQHLPMVRDTIWRVYSMSKITTCVATLILFEERQFNLDDPVANYLPELTVVKVWAGDTQETFKLEPLKQPITIKHLLTRTSGLMCDFTGEDELTSLCRNADLWRGPRLSNFIAKLSKLPLKHQPGDAYTYGVNMDVLGELIEHMLEDTSAHFCRIGFSGR